jgi:hypothetical protein
VAISPRFLAESWAKRPSPSLSKDNNIKTGERHTQIPDTNPYRKITREDLVECLTRLSRTLVVPRGLGGTLTEEICAEYWKALGPKGWSVLRLRELCRIAQANCRFFPTLAELLDIANENPSLGKPPQSAQEPRPDEEPVTEEEFQEHMAKLKKQFNI